MWSCGSLQCELMPWTVTLLSPAARALSRMHSATAAVSLFLM